MDKKFEFNDKKFFILLAVVCILFLIIVINAFSYLPSKTEEASPVVYTEDTINTPAQKQEEVKSQEEANEKVKKTLDIKLPAKTDEDLEIIEIDTPDGVAEKSDVNEERKQPELTAEEKAEQSLKTANQLRNSKQYLKALDEYQKVTSLTADKTIVASSYDGISSLYAINKRYGTALTYAIKAYNMSPTSSRELMLARLYYKTGDVAKATQRINNILRRDFSDDRW